MALTRITPANADQLNRECIADKLRLLNRMITNLYDEALRPAGITTSQMNILVVVARYDTATPGQVGRWLHMERSTLSRNLDRLRKQGLLAATTAGRGRALELRLTAEGTRALQKGLPHWRRVQRKARSLLGEGGVKEVMRIAAKVRAGRA